MAQPGHLTILQDRLPPIPATSWGSIAGDRLGRRSIGHLGDGVGEERNQANLLVALVEQQSLKDWYDIDEFARLVGKAPFTVREWARHGRISAEKRQSGRGAYAAWVVNHAELQRYQREGLRPLVIGNR